MKMLSMIISGAILATANAASATPVFIKYEGLEGETRKPTTSSAPAAPAVDGQRKPGDGEAASGINVAMGDVTGDGRPQAALLLPAVQKVQSAAPGQEPAATSTQGPYQRNIAASPQGAKPKPNPKPEPKSSGNRVPANRSRSTDPLRLGPATLFEAAGAQTKRKLA